MRIAGIQTSVVNAEIALEPAEFADVPAPNAVGVAPHDPLGPFAGATALRFAVSTPNHVNQEEMTGAMPGHFDGVQGPVRMVDGFRGSRTRPVSASRSTRPNAPATPMRRRFDMRPARFSAMARSQTGRIR